MVQQGTWNFAREWKISGMSPDKVKDNRSMFDTMPWSSEIMKGGGGVQVLEVPV